MDTRTDNAINSASNLYEKHSRKYGESPIGKVKKQAVLVTLPLDVI
jgi:hypothetical protein